jgi:hypothetical protein
LSPTTSGTSEVDVKRTPFARKTGLKARSTLKRDTPLRRQSRKAAEKHAGEGGRKQVRLQLLAEYPECQVPEILKLRGMDGVGPECMGASSHVHERLPRSAGGSIVLRANLVAICAACHSWIHDDEPEIATAAGLKVSRYGDEAAHLHRVNDP